MKVRGLVDYLFEKEVSSKAIFYNNDELCKKLIRKLVAIEK